MSENSFNVFDVTELAGIDVPNNALMQMLYQTGYLTIDKLLLLGGRRMYRLRFPNHEVEESFSEYLLNMYAPGGVADSCADQLIIAAYAGDTTEMIDILKGFIADIPYDIQVKDELYYESVVYTIFRMCGMDTRVEVRTNKGRIDAVLNTDDHLYIIEFKLNKTADQAIDQIEEKSGRENTFIPREKSDRRSTHWGSTSCYSTEVRTISTGWREEIL